MEEYKYKDITGKIIGAAMQVHKVLGNGFQEVIYQRALQMDIPVMLTPSPVILTPIKDDGLREL